MPATKDEFLNRLAALGLEHRTVAHPPVFTVEEAKATRDALPGAHTKNLFLKDRGGALVLAVVDADRKVALNAFAKHLGLSRFSFGSPELLMEVLGVTPGAVTAFAVMNDEARRVRVVLDADLLKASLVNGHPLVNDHTTAMTPAALLAFLKACGHEPEIVDFERVA
jgi:Ala-tRNA(Pro) deacylase